MREGSSLKGIPQLPRIHMGKWDHRCIQSSDHADLNIAAAHTRPILKVILMCKRCFMNPKENFGKQLRKISQNFNLPQISDCVPSSTKIENSIVMRTSLLLYASADYLKIATWLQIVSNKSTNRLWKRWILFGDQWTRNTKECTRELAWKLDWVKNHQTAPRLQSKSMILSYRWIICLGVL